MLVEDTLGYTTGVLLNTLSLTLLLQGVGDVILILQRSCKVPARS